MQFFPVFHMGVKLGLYRKGNAILAKKQLPVLEHLTCSPVSMFPKLK
jgi:hypothetical protein